MYSILIVGLGSISDRHRANIKKIYPSANIVCVPSTGKLRKYEIENCDEQISINEASKRNFTHTIICSPSSFHYLHFKELINVSENFLIEKPISHNLQSSEKILALAGLNNKKVYIGYCLRFLESAQSFKNFIQNNLSSEIYKVKIKAGQYLPNWREKDYRKSVSAKKKLGGGVLLELSHEIDYLEWVFGCKSIDKAEIYFTGELDIDVEDKVKIYGKTSSSAKFSICLDFLRKKPIRECMVETAKGDLRWNLNEDSFYYTCKKKNKISYFKYESSANSKYIEMIKAFLSGNQRSDNSLASLESSAKVMKIIDRIWVIGNVIK